MAKMYLMCGMSGSGKTTFAKQFAKENNLMYMGIDEMYAKINGDECIHENSFKVWHKFFEVIHDLAVNNVDCIIDTNALTFCHRTQFLDWFPEFEEHHLIYVRASEELFIVNNNNRRRVIPMERIREMEEMFMSPTLSEQEDPRWTSIVEIENYANNFQSPIYIKKQGAALPREEDLKPICDECFWKNICTGRAEHTCPQYKPKYQNPPIEEFLDLNDLVE